MTLTTEKHVVEDKPVQKLNLFVNQTKLEVTAMSMTPREILALAQEDAAQVTLSLKEQGKLQAYTNLDEPIPLKNGMHFIATYIGPTPVS